MGQRQQVREFSCIGMHSVISACFRGEEMQKVILQRIEEREKALLSENEALRTSLLSFQSDLVRNAITCKLRSVIIICSRLLLWTACKDPGDWVGIVTSIN